MSLGGEGRGWATPKLGRGGRAGGPGRADKRLRRGHWQPGSEKSQKKEKGNFKVGRSSFCSSLCGTFSHMEGGEAATVASAVANSSALYRLLSLTDEAFEADPEKDAKWYDVSRSPGPTRTGA